MCRLHKGRHVVDSLHKVSSLYNGLVSIMARRLPYITRSLQLTRKKKTDSTSLLATTHLSTWAAKQAPWPLLNRVCRDLSPKHISRLLHTTRLSAKGEVCRFHRLRSSLFTRLGRHRLHRPGYQSLARLQALPSILSHPPAGQRMLRQCPNTPHFGRIMTSRENSEPALKAQSTWEDTRQVARLWL